MLAFLKVRRNKLIIGGVLLLLLVLLGLVLFLPRSQPASNSTASGSASVSPSPSASGSASASASVTSRASAPAGPVITATGAVLKTGAAADDTPTLFGNGPGCGIWHHPGWTQDACAIVQVFGSDATGGVAWITEHKASTSGRRVSLMTTGPSDTAWHVKLYAIDDPGGNFVAITVKSGDITGDGQPEILVGIRMVGTGQVLNLDGVQRLSGHDPAVIIHRELVRGHAVLGSGNLTDYSAAGSAYEKTVITYGGGAFHGSTSSVATAAAGDFA